MTKRYALISDGTSDRVLLKIIDWTFYHFLNLETSGERADFYYSKTKPQSISEKVELVIEQYDDLDFIVIHRDAERETYEKRVEEIEKELTLIKNQSLTSIPVIPVRMTEAWLLFDSKAIASASGNPNLPDLPALPPLNTVETLRDPKSLLEKLIKDSCGLRSRGLKKLNTRHCIQLIPDFVEDFSPLLTIPSYQRFKQKILEVFDSPN